MMVVESAMAGARKEVALAAIGVVTTVMGAHGAGPAMTRAMWKRALRAVGVGVEAAVSPNCCVPLMARLELVSAIGQLHVRPLSCPLPSPFAAFSVLPRAGRQWVMQTAEVGMLAIVRPEMDASSGPLYFQRYLWCSLSNPCRAAGITN